MNIEDESERFSFLRFSVMCYPLISVFRAKTEISERSKLADGRKIQRRRQKTKVAKGRN